MFFFVSVDILFASMAEDAKILLNSLFVSSLDFLKVRYETTHLLHSALETFSMQVLPFSAQVFQMDFGGKKNFPIHL